MITELAVIPERLSIANIMTVAETMHKSGYFEDCKSPAQAATKIMIGQDIGVAPWPALTGIHIIKGKPSFSATLIAAMIRNSGKYDYKIVASTDTEAEIEFLQSGQSMGTSKFTMEDAKRAELTSNNMWKKYPRNMLYSRALTNGARQFCPEVSAGIPIYCPEEIGSPIEYSASAIDAEPIAPKAQIEDVKPATAATDHVERLNRLYKYCHSKFLAPHATDEMKSLLEERIGKLFTECCEAQNVSPEDVVQIPPETFAFILEFIKEKIKPLLQISVEQIDLASFPYQTPATVVPEDEAAAPVHTSPI